MHHMAGDWIRPLLSFAVLAVIVGLRMRRAGRSRPLRLRWMWVVPTICIAVATYVFVSAPPVGMGRAYCVAAFLTGGVFGWYRGKFMHIQVDPDSHAISQRATPAALILLFVLIAIRAGLRTVALELGLGAPMLLLVTDILVAFAVGILPMQRLEMALRATRLLKAARGAA